MTSPERRRWPTRPTTLYHGQVAIGFLVKQAPAHRATTTTNGSTSVRRVVDRPSPEAVEAILDFHYPDGRHRDDYGVARWRLQVLADRQVGVRWRQELAKQDDAVAPALRGSVLSGHR